MAAILDYNFAMVKRGLMSQVSQALSFSRCFRQDHYEWKRPEEKKYSEANFNS